MKKILFLMCLFYSSMANAQMTITCSRALDNNDNDSLHRIANVFTKAVGDALKANYPSKVENIEVMLMVNNSGLLKLIYSLDVVPTDTADAQYYFDHRGALSANPTPWIAIEDAKKRALVQMPRVKDVFQKEYSLYITTYYDNKSSVFYNGWTWAINENFIAAGKK